MDYSYSLPDKLIAKAPQEPRDSSRLLVYDSVRDLVHFDIFRNIAHYLPGGALVVLNNTHVSPARIELQKKTGGKVICLFLMNEPEEGQNEVKVMLDRKIEIGQSLYLRSCEIAQISAHREGSVFIATLLITRQQLFDILEKEGNMPIPLYLRSTTLSEGELQEKYQTVFAQKNSSSRIDALSSVAAPTASLHITERVLRSFADKLIDTTDVKLEVGMGTFAPLTESHIREGKLHTEWCGIPPGSIQKILKAKEEKRPVVAVGTTVVRTLESWAGTSSSFNFQPTQIFIKPGHVFHIVDMLVTNFHIPNSSLMMLVQALLTAKKSRKSLIDLYDIAIRENFRFYSFGDAMIII
ncbi:MAG: tRNA preQ1(34) S-adenosylmethionine ribosyltransferase-isomerase QueA [Candidatus Roizmanbacteria bacterium]